MSEALAGLARGAGDAGTIERLSGWSVTLRGRGACATLDGAASLAASLLREFPGEVEAHLARPCDRCVGGGLATDSAARFSQAINDGWGGCAQ